MGVQAVYIDLTEYCGFVVDYVWGAARIIETPG